MKKIPCIFLVFISLLLCLASCKTKSAIREGKDVDSLKMLNKIISEFDLPETYDMYSSNADNVKYFFIDNDTLSSLYGTILETPVTEDITFYALYFSEKVYGFECGVFCMKDKESASKMKDFIELRKNKLIQNAEMYPEVDTTNVSNLKINILGNWVYYAVTDKSEKFSKTAEDFIFDYGRNNH